MVEIEEIPKKTQKRIDEACDVVLDLCAELSSQDTAELGGVGINEDILDQMVLVAVQSLIVRHWKRLARAKVVGVSEEVGQAIKGYTEGGNA